MLVNGDKGEWAGVGGSNLTLVEDGTVAPKIDVPRQGCEDCQCS